jgi:hypothetical protein
MGARGRSNITLTMSKRVASHATPARRAEGDACANAGRT